MAIIAGIHNLKSQLYQTLEIKTIHTPKPHTVHMIQTS